MTARVDINTADKKNVLAVPLSALHTDAKGSYVIIVGADGKTVNKYVQAGIYSDEYVEIVKGLAAGDKIATEYTAKKTTTSSNNHGGPPPF